LGAFLPIPIASGALWIVGVLVLIISIVSLIPLIWLWQMKKLGWTVTIALQVLSIVFSLVLMNWFGIVIPLIIVVYLWLKKDLFK
jgi:hypothetical protein